jgi:pyrroline-5-carboxylate reductase
LPISSTPPRGPPQTPVSPRPLPSPGSAEDEARAPFCTTPPPAHRRGRRRRPSAYPSRILGDLGIVGVGAIAEAIVTGLCEGEDTPASIHLSPRNAARASRLANRYPSVHVVDSNQAVVDGADVVLLCVRPQDAQAVLPKLAFRGQQAVISVIAGIRIDALHRHVAPAEVIVRAIPLPAVATRKGLTAIHPPHEIARAVFDPLGGVVAVDDERAFDALAASTATIAAHMAYLDTISRWLSDRGIPQADATRYVAAVFGALSGTLLATQMNDFRTLAEEYATAGGLNEQFLSTLRRAGTFDVVERALDDVAHRLEAE